MCDESLLTRENYFETIAYFFVLHNNSMQSHYSFIALLIANLSPLVKYTIFYTIFVQLHAMAGHNCLPTCSN